jgi:hypothetical protein
MSQLPSDHALIYAILALNSEVSLQNTYLESTESQLHERDEDQQILADIEQALMEFINLYQQRCKQNPQLSKIDELLTREL